MPKPEAPCSARALVRFAGGKIKNDLDDAHQQDQQQHGGVHDGFLVPLIAEAERQVAQAPRAHAAGDGRIAQNGDKADGQPPQQAGHAFHQQHPRDDLPPGGAHALADYAIAGIDNGGRTYSNFLNSSNNGYGFDAVYQAFNATPGYFLKDDSGELYWGTTTDEMKEALTTLHDWYEKGLINPEVGTTTNGDNANNVKNGTCGIFMGPWWSLGYGNPDSFRNDNNANWQAYPLYTKDGEWNIHMKDVGTTYTMVNKNASDDVKKAIVIMNNVLVRDESTFDTSVAIGWYPLRNCMAATDECEYEYDALMGIIKGEASADDYQQGGSKFNGLYKNLANDAATLKDVISEDYDGSRDLAVTDMDVNTNNGQFNRFYALLIGDRPYATLEPDHKIYSELYYTIDGMDTYWTQISDLEDKSCNFPQPGHWNFSCCCCKKAFSFESAESVMPLEDSIFRSVSEKTPAEGAVFGKIPSLAFIINNTEIAGRRLLWVSPIITQSDCGGIIPIFLASTALSNISLYSLKVRGSSGITV